MDESINLDKLPETLKSDIDLMIEEILLIMDEGTGRDILLELEELGYSAGVAERMITFWVRSALKEVHEGDE